MSASANRAYLICPIGSDKSEVRRRADEIADLIVKPVAELFHLVVMRSDRDPTPGPITARLLRSLLDSRVVIADLTGQNPNVYYELGIVHSFQLPLVILVDNIASLPFDTRNERVIEIGDSDGPISLSQGEDTKASLREALAVVLDDNYVPSSLVTEVAGVQSLDKLAPDNPLASELGYVRRRLNDVYEMTSRLAAGQLPMETYSELEELRQFFADLVDKRFVSEQLLRDLLDHREYSPTIKDLISDHLDAFHA